MKLFRPLILLVSIFLLVGCNPPGTMYPQLVNQQQNQQKQIDALQQKLLNRGIFVTTIGENVFIILPSDRLFNSGSANLTSDAESDLAAVIQLMRCYQATLVKISGYTNMKPDEQLNRALSALQAQRVADYIWTQGIDARIVYALGMGRENPISLKQSASADATNRRITIMFQYVPAISY